MQTPKPDRPPRVPRPPKGSGKHGRPTYGQAARITKMFNGPTAFAAAVGVDRVTIHRWNYAKPYGTDGLIPAAMVERVERAARVEGILLTPNDWAHTRIDYDVDDASATPALTLAEVLS